MYPNTFEEACTSTGENPNDEKFSSGTADEISYKKLKVETKAINMADNDGKEWIPDWDDNDEYKWRGWWDLEVDKNNPSGFRFNGSAYGRTYAGAPARLCYKTESGLLHSAEKFLPDWRVFIKGE